ncbi:hypothetical protein QYE76_032116 [Lolium multiflorum]|uniref:Uncharacterized protein n=1 Tax=Lolium multiflorum TaxID=4521 RepID=A0AAD8QWL2_LOLMU|nr:hypothetical protein QYE76_032116 [Lolium multiflorum]
MALKRAFAPGGNDDEAGKSRRIAPALRAARQHGGLHIQDAGQVVVALAQSAPVPKPEEEEDPDLRAALAVSLEEEAAKWLHFAEVLRTSAMEEEPGRGSRTPRPRLCWARRAGRRRSGAGTRRPGARRSRSAPPPQGGGGAAGGQPSGPAVGLGRGLVVVVAGVPGGHSSHNSASPPEGIIDAHGDERPNTYTRATTIEDLDRCIRDPRESTHRWVQRWQDLWTTSTRISADTAIYCFKRCYRYEPLIANLKRCSRDVLTMTKLMDIAKRYADEAPPLTRMMSSREPKSSHSDDRVPPADRPPGKRFSAKKLLDAPCIYHSREGKPTTHTTANCFSLKLIEKALRAKENAGGDQNKHQHHNTDKPKEDGFSRDADSFHTFTGVGDRRDNKVLARAVAVNVVVVDVPRWLNLMRVEPVWVARSHESNQEHKGVRDEQKNTMNTRTDKG